MKSIFARIAFSLSLLFLFVPQVAYAVMKTFIKEYTYQASEEDSRNSSRVIALREVKRLLLEELGTYLESQTEVKNFQLTKDQITTLTAGIVQAEIVAEKWDGHVYWLKSRITADSDKVVQSINALRKDRDKTRELRAMKLKADELMAEVERLRKAMAAKDGNSDAQKTAYDKSIRELSAAEWIEKGHAAKDAAEAVKAYSQAVKLDPANIEAYYFRARSSERNQALSDYYKILSIPARNSEGHLIRAWTYKELDQRDPALQEFGKAVQTARGNKEKALAYFDRGRYYYLHYLKHRSSTDKPLPGDCELSVQDFSNAIALDPTDSSYFVNRGNSYASLELHDLAIGDYTAGIRLEPKNASLYAIRGIYYEMLEKHEPAIADLSRAIELEGQDSIFAAYDYRHRAYNYESLGKFDLAIKDWNVLYEKEQEDPSIIFNLANLYRKLGKYDQAIKYYDKAAAFKLAYYDAYIVYHGRALAYAANGNAKKATADLRYLIQRNPGYRADFRNEKGFDSIRNDPDFINLFKEN